MSLVVGVHAGSARCRAGPRRFRTSSARVGAESRELMPEPYRSSRFRRPAAQRRSGHKAQQTVQDGVDPVVARLVGDLGQQPCE